MYNMYVCILFRCAACKLHICILEYTYISCESVLSTGAHNSQFVSHHSSRKLNEYPSAQNHINFLSCSSGPTFLQTFLEHSRSSADNREHSAPPLMPAIVDGIFFSFLHFCRLSPCLCCCFILVLAFVVSLCLLCRSVFHLHFFLLFFLSCVSFILVLILVWCFYF